MMKDRNAERTKATPSTGKDLTLSHGWFSLGLFLQFLENNRERYALWEKVVK